MDTKSEDRTALRAAAIKNEQTASPRREPRKAANKARGQIAIPFQSGGAFDSQVDSQEFVERLYEKARQPIRVRGRSENPPNPDEDVEELTLRTAAEDESDRLRTASPTPSHEELSPRAVEAEEECERVYPCKRIAKQWRNAAKKASTALERAAKDISIAADELDVVEEVVRVDVY
ncbi:hypothetical protein B0H19DRAFT_1084670 [Mycena capillaripes]|nr:hypothetical protein B0H19DRAFT_1084670 [Mycena capillaripes]